MKYVKTKQLFEKTDAELKKDYEQYLKDEKENRENKLAYDEWLEKLYFYHQN